MLPAHLVDWLDLGLRWLHVIAGVVWIGTSFYFIWLNNRMRPIEPDVDWIEGQLWAVHGGGFYRVLNYGQTPPSVPEVLHWFKWEAYATWLSGFALLVLIYYLDAEIFLIDPAAADLEPWQAAGIGIGSLVVGWLVYDRMCKSSLLERPGWFGAVSLVLVALTALLLSEVFSGRGAYIHVGALLGTLMAGNVFFVIIPAQKEMVAAMEEGREQDVQAGRHAALRSLHNNYLTLPVLFIMVSNHLPFTYEHEWNWAILVGLSVIGVATRHWYNLRGQGKTNVWILPATAAGLIALVVVTAPNVGSSAGDVGAVSYEEGIAIVQARCLACHSATPSQPGFTSPPKGLVFDTEAQIVASAALIRRVAVDTVAMPPGNLTQMTDEERAKLRAWLDTHTDG